MNGETGRSVGPVKRTLRFGFTSLVTRCARNAAVGNAEIRVESECRRATRRAPVRDSTGAAAPQRPARPARRGGKDDARDRALRVGHAKGALYDTGRACSGVMICRTLRTRHVLEQREEIDPPAACRCPFRYRTAGYDGDHGLVVQLGVVQRVE